MDKKPSVTKKSGVFGKLMKYIKPMWGILFVIVFFSLLGSVLNMIVPSFMQKIVDEIQNGILGEFKKDTVVFYALLTAGVLLIAYLCNLLQSLISPLLAQKIAHRMREQLNKKSNLIPLNFFDTTPEGETLSTMTNDVDTISTSFSSTLPTIIASVATLIGCTVLMFITNWLLAVITIVTSILGTMITFIVIGKGAPYFKKNQDLLGKLNAIVNEDVKGHLIIKSFNAEDEAVAEFNKTNEELLDSVRKTQFITYLTAPLSTLASNLSYIVICIVGAILVINGQMQIGTIIAFILYAQLFMSPFSQLTQSAGTIQPAFAAGERIFDMLEQPEMEDNGQKEVDAGATKGEVDFEHIKFGYIPENIIIHDFSCHVKPGQKVAIVGPTGAGKSTLINLLTRFYELNGGDIRIDGVSIYDMPRETLHDMISMVLQETWVFQGTIRDNIVYSKKGVTEEQLRTVIEKCGLDDFISKCSDGLDTVLSEKTDISAGQKQLITIARAMLDDAPILILDEATSSVDTRTEKIISTAIDNLMKGKTGFVIAHRLSTIKNADMILVLKEGDIVEVGTHDELMAKKGFYADLYMSQFDH